MNKIDLSADVIISGTNNGIEQPVFNPRTNLFYVSLPATNANPGGEVIVIDPVAPVGSQVINHFGVADCIPNGLALGPHGHLLLGCSNERTIILDENGGVLANITQVGGSDEVWFNPGDNRYYLAAFLCTTPECQAVSPTVSPAGSYPVLGVIDAKTNKWIENVPTLFPSHSVAVNPTNNHIFVPVALPGAIGADDFGIAVYEHEGERPDMDEGPSPWKE